jgi:tRNA (Thr-GGU) A37 N-methylase
MTKNREFFGIYPLNLDFVEVGEQKYIIDLLDDSPVMDIEKWINQDVWLRHEQEIKKEGGFMEDE